jgi:hypothetical protein
LEARELVIRLIGQEEALVGEAEDLLRLRVAAMGLVPIGG